MWCYAGFLCLTFVTFPSVAEGFVGLKTIFFKDLCIFSRTSYIQTIYLGPTIKDYNSSAILKAKDFGFYSTDVSCTVFVVPPPGYGVVASLRSIDFRPSCVDNLTLTDLMNYNTTFCGRKSYSKEKMSVFSTGKLTVIFKTGSLFEGSLGFHDGFEFTVTAYKNWPCSSRFEFECSNLRCISGELVCDGHNHCGDRSDQSRCGIKSVGGIVGVVFGCIFVTVGLVAGVVHYQRKRRYRSAAATRTYLRWQPPQHQVYGGTCEPYGQFHQPLQVSHNSPQPYPFPQQKVYPPLLSHGVSPTSTEASREQRGYYSPPQESRSLEEQNLAVYNSLYK